MTVGVWKRHSVRKKLLKQTLTSFMERSTPPPPPKKKKKKKNTHTQSHGKRHSVRKKLLKCTLISLMERSQTSTNLKCLWLGQSNNPYCLPGILTRPWELLSSISTHAKPVSLDKSYNGVTFLACLCVCVCVCVVCVCVCVWVCVCVCMCTYIWDLFHGQWYWKFHLSRVHRKALFTEYKIKNLSSLFHWLQFYCSYSCMLYSLIQSLESESRSQNTCTYVLSESQSYLEQTCDVICMDNACI